LFIRLKELKMKIFNADETHALLDDFDLIEALLPAFMGTVEAPKRHQHTMEMVKNEDPTTLLLMPAWEAEDGVGIKIVTVTPGNMERGLASVGGQYLLLDGTTQVPKALFDGAALTVRRTAATSALASRYLSNKKSKTLLMVGTGALAPHLIKAHSLVRPIENVIVWGRNFEKTDAFANTLNLKGLKIVASKSLEEAVKEADIISCATLSTSPLILGDWVNPSTHIDLVGAYRPDMRESDDALIIKAKVFVDTYAGALAEGGDILQPLEAQIITQGHVLAEMKDLISENHNGRSSEKDITLFKSVGASLEDYAAARLAWDVSTK